MFSKQLTSKLKEEQERENQHNPSHLNVAQCDRLIRTVSCKHDTNHAIRKANINVLQSFDEIKLYSVPSRSSNLGCESGPEDVVAAASASNGQQRISRRGGTNTLSSSPKFASPGHQGTTQRAVAHSTASSDIIEVNLKELLDQIVSHVNKHTQVSEWFKLASPRPSVVASPAAMLSPTEASGSLVNGGSGLDDSDVQSAEQSHERDLFESIENALAHIDFNLKRNSDFINELTKLLDTSRAIQQEKHLKKLLKSLEDEKLSAPTSLNVPPVVVHGTASSQSSSQSQPSSPNLRVGAQLPPPSPQIAAGLKPNDDKQISDDQRKKHKSKSFKGFASFKTRSSSKDNREAGATTTTTTANSNSPSTQDPTGKSNSHLSLPPASGSSHSAQKSWSSWSHLNNANELNSIQNQLRLTQSGSCEVNNSDYTELEFQVERISYHIETLKRAWTKLGKARTAALKDQSAALRFSLEFQTTLAELNSCMLAKELEQSLFKLNWLITSKSGFSEPNWQSSVLSLTPSTIDSFIGVNLLKNYYRYVKYDFVSYKLFTRQLQLIQIGAAIVHLVASILGFYKDMTGGSVEAARIESFAGLALTANLGGLADSQHALHSFNFSADKFRPISWSANHVTLYNIQATTPETNLNPMLTSGKSSYGSGMRAASNLSRSSSTRRGEAAATSQTNLGREDQVRQMRGELFASNIDEFLTQTTQRLNIQASLANRTGYFYIVNQSTGLVLQAVDFTSEFSSLREQIESNQRRIQSSSLKATSSGARATGLSASKSPSSVSKGPRFFLMPKIGASNSSATAAAAAAASNGASSSSLSVETAHDEQLFYYYLINGCIANKIIRSGYCMAASSLNPKSPVTFWPNVKTTNCSWYFNYHDQTIVSGLCDDLVLDYVILDETPNQRYAVVIDTRVCNKASQKWTFEFN